MPCRKTFYPMVPTKIINTGGNLQMVAEKLLDGTCTGGFLSFIFMKVGMSGGHSDQWSWSAGGGEGEVRGWAPGLRKARVGYKG